MTKISFKVLGLDCAEEVALLRREVGPLAGGADDLEFDILNSRMTVAGPDDPAFVGQIQHVVSSTGMRAIRWEDYLREGSRQESFWTRRGRTVLCAISGASLAGGFLWHVYRTGSLMVALSGAEVSSESSPAQGLPLASRYLYLAAAVIGAWHVVPKALAAARRFQPDINLLMVVAIIGAMWIGQWFEAGAVAFLFSLALLLESWSVSRARRAIRSLMDLTPRTARVVEAGTGHFHETPVSDVRVGSTLAVRPGERIPLDGVVSKGESSVNESPITGESIPVAKSPGSEVFAGTINSDGAFEFTSTRPESNTTLARLIKLVEEAGSRRAVSEQWVEKFARIYTPMMLLLATFVAVVPPVLSNGDWRRWFYEGLVLLVIACPCALVISTPVSIIAALTAASRAGVLIKGGSFLEAVGGVRAIAFDKTGTLSHGRPVVQDIIPMNGHTSLELLSRAAALETHSLHPLARSILRKAEAENAPVLSAEDYQVIPGKGAQGTIGGKRFWIGSHRFVHELNVEEAPFHELATRLEDAGHSLVIVGNAEHICGAFSVADSVREQARATIEELKRLGVRHVVMLTGDNQRSAEAIAQATGVDAFRAELLPQDKVSAVGELEAMHGRLAMVGDGINDAPAMAAASLGIAMAAAGADAAIETADIALMSDDLARLPWLIRHSRRTLSIIKQNVAIALGLKLVFMFLAVSGKATLWMAITADMGATLLVVFNGLRLLKSPIAKN